MISNRKGYLEDLGVSSSEIQTDDKESEVSPALALQKWLQQLPDNIMGQVDLAIKQERPFMPPDVTPEMMTESNNKVPGMDHFKILCRCLDCAMRAKDYEMAAAIIYVVDRACYRFGRSEALLKIVDEIMQVSLDIPIAPQVVLRKARVLKDTGDLHGAMKILDAVVSKESKWDYKNNSQYENTKAVCVQIKGQILHNLGLWKEAVPPLLESIHSFGAINDNKGISSSLGLLARCLNKLSTDDYIRLRTVYPEVFKNNHPCYEAYEQGLEAVQLIQNLGDTLYVAKHQLVADESLLMFAILQRAASQKRRWFQTILEEMKRSLAGHRNVQRLNSIESFFEFVRGLFMISLTLAFCPAHQDMNLARFLERLSMELYGFMCTRPGSGEDGNVPSSSLEQTKHSVRLMNGALTLLGLPPLEGSATVEYESDSGREDKGSNRTGTDGMEESSSSSLPSSGGISNQQSNQSQPFSWEILSSNQSNCVPRKQSAEVSQSKSSNSWEIVAAQSCSEPFSESNSDVGNHKPQSHIADFADKATTFPDLSGAKTKSRLAKSSGNLQLNFVGLPISRDQLKWATCPAFLPETAKSQAEEETDSFASDLEGLLISAKTIASTSSSKLGSGDRSDVHATVDLSSPTQSTPSETHDGSTSDAAHRINTPPCGVPLPCEASSFSSSEGPDQGILNNQGKKLTHSDSSIVNLSATTKPSSTNTTDDEDASPLVHLSASTACIMADLKLGESLPTSDSAESLASWTPSSDSWIHRAILLLYNPENGQWSAQKTLAYVGPMLKTDRKGSFRDAFHVSYLHQDEPLGRYVGKRYRKQREPKVYMQDVVCQQLAALYVTQFNQALQNCTDDILRIQLLTAAHLQLLNTDGEVDDWINVEPFVHGNFLKLTSNQRYVSPEQANEKGVEVATALSHFSYTSSGGNLMVVDLQGWLPSDRKGIVYLTDPVFHTQNIPKISSCDLREAGMQAFWKHVHPQCNKICRFLQLDKLRPDNKSSIPC